MICLLTGASGFLGKRVLDLLVADERIEKIHVVSRRELSHPNPKVLVHTMDLTLPWVGTDFIEDVDVVIHLSGLYQFSLKFSQNYQQNVLPVLNLIDRVRSSKRAKKPTVLLASTYAVGLGARSTIKEESLALFPPLSEPYAYTKALAERALMDSGLPARIFRLGILVGDSVSGEMEKIDGPYYLMKFLYRLESSPVLKKLKKLPLPIPEGTSMPLAPVDSVANVFHKALFLPPMKSNQKEVYGVFNEKSIDSRLLIQELFKEVNSQCRPLFLNRTVSDSVLNLQMKLTGIPKEAFYYVFKPIGLANPKFRTTFGEEFIPHFNSYRGAYFSGFKRCFLGEGLRNADH